MKTRIELICRYFLFWFFYFLSVKTLFIVFNIKLARGLNISDFINIYLHGLKMDVSASTYLLLLPFLFILPSIFFSSYFIKIIKTFIKWYTIVLVAIISFLVIIDLELYKYWGYRLNKSPIVYINTPKEMLASVEWYVIVKQLLIFILIIIACIYFFKFFIYQKLDKIKKGKWWELVILIILLAFLIIPIRGGIGLAPLNTGTAYFCNKEFANHSAINVFWNFCYSFTENETIKNPYIEFSKEEAEKEILPLFSQHKGLTNKLLNANKPNLLIIMVESFTAKLISSLGGINGVTPRFNKLVHDGILFKNFYSNGVRSDKGLVAILSGYPSQPVNSIMKFPNKTESLPYLSGDLLRNGYHTAYYYGGNIDFVSMRSYVYNAKFENIISMTDFPSSSYNSKWGVHDHIVFNRLLGDIDKIKPPFFYYFFTLSSHEPFDVPMKTVIRGNDLDHKFMNSVYYTDSCLGNFIDSAQKKTWWKNTLIIITADHGALMPNYTPNYEPIRFHIPMLWIGGAVAVKDTVINAIGSQIDIAMTILNQLNIKPIQPFRYSKDLLSESGKKFAFFVFDNGFGFITDTCKLSYDYNQKRIKIFEGVGKESILKMGKAYLQVAYDDFIFRK